MVNPSVTFCITFTSIKKNQKKCPDLGTFISCHIVPVGLRLAV